MKYVLLCIAFCGVFCFVAPVTAQQTMAPYTFEWEVVAVDSICLLYTSPSPRD